MFVRHMQSVQLNLERHLSVAGHTRMILSALAVLSSAHRGEQTYVLFLLVKSCIETLGKLFAVVLQWAAQAKWTSEQQCSWRP